MTSQQNLQNAERLARLRAERAQAQQGRALELAAAHAALATHRQEVRREA